MSTESSPADPPSRLVGGTEYSWCRAVLCGTGVTALSLLFSKPPNVPHLQSCIHAIQNAHPILRSKLKFNTANSTFSFFTPSTSSNLQITSSDSNFTFYQTLEHEINTNPWKGNESESETGTDVMFANVYNLQEGKYVVVLRLHTAVCDRASAAYLLRELLKLIGNDNIDNVDLMKEEGLGLALEDCVPAGKASKPFWSRGADMLGYSVNSFRFSNLDFKESGFPKSTEFVRLKIGLEDTEKILSGCKSRGIKLFGLSSAAGFISAHASKKIPDEKWEKYSLATLVDCRSLLDPVLGDHHVGNYHSAILSSHDVKGGEDVWDLAQKIYSSLETAKNNNKHFTDMADLHFLMGKAIDNPGLTPSSSLRTSLFSVFEESLIENTNQLHKDIGLLDCIGCASVHGVSPSLAIFDTINDGQLDCACMYPSPTHSREQMQDFVDHMKKILIEAASVPQ
ncbi:uncharacterized protein [Rutidosis leptorrhynchoides]|uniref:uncharacterized protein n=1 Tax=Rutidosis leptorrhynchoides TaxID=125765 RepID=UPI003A99A5C7